MKGPPITVACECGTAAHVPYGETWTCETCGRRWNTNQIPADAYWEILRDMRRYRLYVIGFAFLMAALFGALALLVSPGLILLLPVVMSFWFIWFMPWWRRKVRERARSLPKWTLTPE